MSGRPSGHDLRRAQADWRALSQADLDREYSPSTLAADFAGTLTEYRRRSDRARDRLTAYEDVPYGSASAETLHAFPARTVAAPLVVYVHGGHWQESSKEDGCFAAEQFVADGVAFASLGYGLAPDRTLPEMVASVRSGLNWLIRRAHTLGASPDRVYAAGHSAGAHLVASAVCMGGGGDAASTPALAGAFLLSGAYDLEPLRHSYVNDRLGLDEPTARRMSPQWHLPLRCEDVVVARAEAETGEYARQQDGFLSALASAGQRALGLVVRSRDHFDLPLDLADPGTVLGRAVRERIGCP